MKITYAFSLQFIGLREIKGAGPARRSRADYLPSLVEKILILLIGTRLAGDGKGHIFLSYFPKIHFGIILEVDVRTIERRCRKRRSKVGNFARTWDRPGVTTRPIPRIAECQFVPPS